MKILFTHLQTTHSLKNNSCISDKITITIKKWNIFEISKGLDVNATSSIIMLKNDYLHTSWKLSKDVATTL